MPAEIVWSAGGSARVTAAEGMHVSVRSTRPFPPGAPVPGTIDGDAFTLKIASVHKLDAASWEIRGRLLTPRAQLIAAFARAAGTARGS